MPVIPTFVPAQAPDTTTNLNQNSQANESSWMTQAQNRAQSAQTFQNQQQVFQATLPALQAKAQADTLMDQSAITQAQITQKLRADSATQAPAALGEYLDWANPEISAEDGTPDYQGQYAALSAIQGKYSNLALLPETKPLYDQIETAKKAAYDMAMKHNTAEYALELATQRANDAANVAIIRGAYGVQGADVRAGATTGAAATRAAGAEQVAQTNAGAKTAGLEPQMQQQRAAFYERQAKFLNDSGDKPGAAAAMQKAQAIIDGMDAGGAAPGAPTAPGSAPAGAAPAIDFGAAAKSAGLTMPQ
jgi:hypothetical protein